MMLDEIGAVGLMDEYRNRDISRHGERRIQAIESELMEFSREKREEYFRDAVYLGSKIAEVQSILKAQGRVRKKKQFRDWLKRMNVPGGLGKSLPVMYRRVKGKMLPECDATLSAWIVLFSTERKSLSRKVFRDSIRNCQPVNRAIAVDDVHRRKQRYSRRFELKSDCVAHYQNIRISSLIRNLRRVIGFYLGRTTFSERVLLAVRLQRLISSMFRPGFPWEKELTIYDLRSTAFSLPILKSHQYILDKKAIEDYFETYLRRKKDNARGVAAARKRARAALSKAASSKGK